MMGCSGAIGRQILLGLIWCFGLTHSAQSTEVDDTTIHAIASMPGWLKLLHYEADRISPSGWRGAIHSEGFFLAPEQGPSSPTVELVANLRAMTSAVSDESAADEHASCRFPARRQWLQRVLGEAFKPVVPPCTAWQTWSRGERIRGLSIVLATGYLGNPASYYGHTFLKFDFGIPQYSNLQDLTVNYGAIVESPDDPVTYILKGVFGGYDGGFSDIAYHFHRTQYGENELRDLWEYQLNISAEEARFVAAHAWEVIGQRYDYFFFRRNCAYRMAEIVEVLDGVGLIPQSRPWTLPQATIQLAAQTNRADGQALVRKITHAPSRQKRFYDSHDALGPAERQVLREVALLEQLSGHTGYDKLPVAGKQATLDALIDYHLFVVDTADKEAGRMHPMYTAALAERYALPPSQRVAQPQSPPPPHESRPPSYAQVALVKHPTDGWQTQFRFRAAYYDALDADAAHVRYSSLSMGDLTLRHNGRRLRLHQLDLIDIESANPGVSGLPGDQGEAWRLRAGWEPQYATCIDCLTARVQADRGLGRRLSRNLHGTMLVGGALQTRSHQHGIGFGRLTGTLLWQPSPDTGVRLQLERRFPMQSTQEGYWTRQVDLRWRVRPAMDVRVRLQNDSVRPHGTAWSVGVGGYW